MNNQEKQKLNEKFYDLIYAGGDVEGIIKKKYPFAKIKDASDYIHTERFEVEIEGVTDEEFYPFAISEGFGSCCFTVALLLAGLKFKELKDGPKHSETIEKLQRWADKAKTEKLIDKEI